MSTVALLRAASCTKFSMNALLQPTSAVFLLSNQPKATAASNSGETFWTKNAKLQRPVSPWMIYKPQITSMLSITHRGTGLGLGVLLYGWGINALFSSNTNWAQTLTYLHEVVPSSAIVTLKVLVAGSVVYHTVNGMRHLAWDMGYGFTLRELYTSGYAVLAITLLATIATIYSL